MLFLGAGASKSLGVPDLPALTKKIEGALASQGYGEVMKAVNLALRALYDSEEIDIELIFTVLDALREGSSAHSVARELGPLASYLGDLPAEGQLEMVDDVEKAILATMNTLRKLLPKNGDVDEMMGIAQNVILNECRNIDAAKVAKAYNDLYGLKTQRVHLANGSEINEDFLSPIVTTNYDLAVELYRRKKGESALDRGFVWNQTESQYLLQLPQLRDSRSNIGLLKLHGSIDWAIRDDGQIVQKEGLDSFYGERYTGRLMVYPIYEKHVSKDPSSSLFICFRNLLSRSNVFIVIGYSFRDQSINNAFLDALLEDRKKRIIIVNTDETVMSRVQFPESQTNLIPTPFGDSETTDHIRVALSDLNATKELRKYLALKPDKQKLPT